MILRCDETVCLFAAAITDTLNGHERASADHSGTRRDGRNRQPCLAASNPVASR